MRIINTNGIKSTILVSQFNSKTSPDPKKTDEQYDWKNSDVLKLPKINWTYPSKNELREEFSESEIDNILMPIGHPKKEYIDEAFNFFTSNLTKRTIKVDDLSKKNSFRFIFKDYDTLKKVVTSYGGPKDPDRIVSGIKNGSKIPMPVAVEMRSGELVLAGGATRVSIARLANLPIDILVIKEEDAMIWRSKKTIQNIKELINELDLSDKIEKIISGEDIENDSFETIIIMSHIEVAEKQLGRKLTLEDITKG